MRVWRACNWQSSKIHQLGHDRNNTHCHWSITGVWIIVSQTEDFKIKTWIAFGAREIFKYWRDGNRPSISATFPFDTHSCLSAAPDWELLGDYTRIQSSRIFHLIVGEWQSCYKHFNLRLENYSLVRRHLHGSYSGFPVRKNKYRRGTRAEELSRRPSLSSPQSRKFLKPSCFLQRWKWK